jgi:hypothetical protein
VKRGRSHDYLDAEAMAYAAAKMIGLERLPDTTRRPAPQQAATATPAAPFNPFAKTVRRRGVRGGVQL